jgi:uncharacterized protein (DUF58 family)
MKPIDSNAWMASEPRRNRRFTWNALLWALIFPRQVTRIIPTVPGLVLVALSMGIGMAAYNSSSNILFLTLSLLLTCIVLSGVLSWLNFRGVTWDLKVAPALRAGHETIIGLQLRNAKAFLPTYGLWFNLIARARRPLGEQRAESTVTGRGIDVRAALAQADAAEARGRIVLQERLDSGGEVGLEWVFKPAKRGMLRLELSSVGSLFPFGFLRKDIGTAFSTEVVVWPAAIEYRRHAPLAARRRAGDERVSRPGAGSDLLAVRRYAAGDSHRLIHWKASARTRQLLVRQFAAETAEGCNLWLRTDAGMWPRPEQFELLISFAATLAEDLFRAGRLLTVAVDSTAPNAVHRVRDLELFLNELAVLQPTTGVIGASGRSGARHNLLTFAPDGTRTVSAFLDGQLVAAA